MTEKGKALWVLALLSPIIAEMLSGSSPPREFFFPVSFALLLALYGGGVLLVRELSVIWDKGWVSIIVMGAAYGILEEGVAIKSFFDPTWMDLGGLGEYGRYVGTNWVWAVWLSIYHSAISITLPIFLVSMLYPRLRQERLLTRRGFETVLVILFLDVLVCTTLLNPYVPYMPMYLLSIGAVFMLVFMAKELPKNWLAPFHPGPTWSPMRFAVLGFLFIMMSFLMAGFFVDTTIPFLVPIAIELSISGCTFILIVEHIGLANNIMQRAGLASGLLAFFVVLGIGLMLSGWFDMAIPVVGTVFFIIDLNRWARGKRVLVFRVGRWIYGDSKPRNSAATYAAR